MTVEYEVVLARVDWATGKVVLTYPSAVKHGIEPYDPQQQLVNAIRATDHAAAIHAGEGIPYSDYRAWLREHP